MARANKASAAKKSAAKKATAKKSAKKASASSKRATKRSSGKSPTKKRTAKQSPNTKGSSKKGSRKTSSTKTSSGKKPKAASSKASTAPKKSTGTTGAASKQSSGKKKAASPTKTSRAKSPFDKKFLDKMRKLLLTERETYDRQAQQLRAEAQSLVDSMEPGDVNFDEEGGEGDTIAVERNRDLALASKAMEMIDEIDHALAKFDDGTYGICEVSDEPIPEERLEAIPWARERVEYKVGGFGRR